MGTLTLPIVAGRRYVRRDGVTVTARAKHRSIGDLNRHEFVYVGLDEDIVGGDPHLHAYTETGRIMAGTLPKHDHLLDLVADSPAGHPHAALMLQYAQDAAETAKPWLRWEFRRPGLHEWRPFTNNPRWEHDCAYRRKPTERTVTLTLPEPLRAAPPVGTVVWMADVWFGSASFFPWNVGVEYQQRWLAAGLLYATESDAQRARDALLGALR